MNITVNLTEKAYKAAFRRKLSFNSIWLGLSEEIKRNILLSLNQRIYQVRRDIISEELMSNLTIHKPVIKLNFTTNEAKMLVLTTIKRIVGITEYIYCTRRDLMEIGFKLYYSSNKPTAKPRRGRGMFYLLFISNQIKELIDNEPDK